MSDRLPPPSDLLKTYPPHGCPPLAQAPLSYPPPPTPPHQRSLILINEGLYSQLKQQIVASQVPDRQAHLAACLDKLMVVRPTRGAQRAQCLLFVGPAGC